MEKYYFISYKYIDTIHTIVGDCALKFNGEIKLGEAKERIALSRTSTHTEYVVILNFIEISYNIYEEAINNDKF